MRKGEGEGGEEGGLGDLKEVSQNSTMLRAGDT